MTGPSLLSQVFGAGTPQTGDPQEADRAERAALIQSGLTLASHRGPGALLASLGAGQEAYSKAAQAAQLEAQAQRQAQTRQMLHDTLLESANDPDSLVSTARFALASGDIDGAKAMLEMAKLEASLKANTRTMLAQNPKTGEAYIVNLDTGEKIGKPVFGASAMAGADPKDILEMQSKILLDFKGEISPPAYDSLPAYIKQLRGATDAAVSGDARAQEVFLRALFRIQNKGLRRVSDDQVFAQAEKEGLMNGKIGQDWMKLTTGKLPGADIAQWLPIVDAIIKGDLAVYDGYRNANISRALQAGLNPAFVFDHFAEIRNGSVPGVDPEAVRKWNSLKPLTRPQ